ncbi:DUF2946 family protein [Burkholderia sp. L27(2015)]|uniref:DUF2946 family protein n=1 Tax=Burkholderia sp. L27(2015) TaxID=1641858 RepID=UPI00131B6B63
MFAPLASQLVQCAYADEPWAPICSASIPADAQHHAPVTSTLNACGYCDLLAHHSPALLANTASSKLS